MHGSEIGKNSGKWYIVKSKLNSEKRSTFLAPLVWLIDTLGFDEIFWKIYFSLNFGKKMLEPFGRKEEFKKNFVKWQWGAEVRRKSAKMFGNDFCDFTNFFLTARTAVQNVNFLYILKNKLKNKLQFFS